METSLTEFEKALVTLAKALAEPKTDITRDASIQRFEFCVELAWKSAKKKLGTSSSAPRVIVRELATQGLISDPEKWFTYLEARNLSSHTYKESIAEKVYAITKEFLPDAQALLAKLQAL